MTLLESKTTPTASNHRTGSAGRKNLLAHLPAENRNWGWVDECTLEKITSRVNKHLENSQPDETTSEHRKRLRGYPDKWQQAHLEKEQKAYPEETRRAQRAIGDGMCTKHRADVKCTYKCTELEDDKCNCKSTGEMMGRFKRVWSMPNECMYVYWSSSERDWKWSPNVLYSLPNGIGSDSHHVTSQETVTEWHHVRQMRQLPSDYHWDFAATKITVEGLQIGIE